LVQARAAGAVEGGRAELRKLLRATQPLRYYDPSGDRAAWDRAADRIHGRTGRKEDGTCA
ncbi:rhamnulokinase, partial [Streptomyces sp. Act-28]